MKVDTIPTSEAAGLFSDYNPRVISPRDLSALEASLRVFGFVEPVVINRRSEAQGWPAGTGPCVVGGHQRIRAASNLGIDACPVVWVDLDATREKELNLGLNRISGDWDEDKLSELIAGLSQEPDAELALTGFGDAELERLVRDAGTGPPVLDLEAGERPEVPRTNNNMDKMRREIGTGTWVGLTFGTIMVVQPRAIYEAAEAYITSEAFETQAAGVEELLRAGLCAVGQDVDEPETAVAPGEDATVN